MLSELFERLKRRDRRALSRLLSLAARGEALGTLPPAEKPARVIAFTGSAGVGKSSLVGKMIDRVRRAGRTVAVLACDPQSPLTGGALLGDRFRMGSRADDGVFIRSLATESGREAIAENLPSMLALLEVFGFDLIFVETVGAGQGDVAVGRYADAVVLLVQPEAGDDLQFEKAGVLEIADVIALNKADLPGAEQTMAEIRSVLETTPKPPAVVAVSAAKNQGLDELWNEIEKLPSRRAGSVDYVEELVRFARASAAARLRLLAAEDPDKWRAILERIQQSRDGGEREMWEALAK